MFKLSLVEKHSPPSTFFPIYTLVGRASLTLLIPHKCQCCWLKS